MNTYLYHHGIKGMRWGVRRTPEQLGHRPPGKREERGKGLVLSPPKQAAPSKRPSNAENEGEGKQRKGLSEGQKRALKIGAATLLTAAAAYGAYRYADAHPEVLQRGKDMLNKALGKVGNKKTEADGTVKDTKTDAFDAQQGAPKISSFSSNPVNGWSSEMTGNTSEVRKTISESWSESLKNTNPLYSTDLSYQNNCTSCAMAGILRTLGYDVEAKPNDGRMGNLGGMLEDCFKDKNGNRIKVLDGSAVKFGISPEDAAEMLVNRFGQNARGVVGIQWKHGEGQNADGHAFSWIIENGKVSFQDYQSERGDGIIRSRYWNHIDPNGSLTIARLDDAVPVWDKLRDWMHVRG